MIYDPQEYSRKKIIYLGSAVLAALLVILTGLIIWRKGKRVVPSPAGTLPKLESAEEKQKNILEAVNKASEGATSQTVANPQDDEAAKREQEKKQKDMLEAVNKANSGTSPASGEEADKRVQDMLDVINAANAK